MGLPSPRASRGFKRLLAGAGAGIVLVLGACGGDDPSGGQQDSGGRVVASEDTGPGEPTVQVPPGPPPKRLIVRDIRKGSGPPADEGSDEIVVHYIGADYRTRDEFYNTWDRGGPSKYRLEEVHRGWEIGLRGMRVGGRREILEPSKLAYGTGALVYVIDMMAVRE